MTTLDTEIRQLKPLELCTLGQILSQQDAWKKLMAIIPKDEYNNSNMFNNDDFIMIEQAARQQRRSAADTFLSEWSTIGKKRPTCRSLLHLLTKANLFRAADYLTVNVLKDNAPERPKIGPAAIIDVSEKALEELLNQQIAGMPNDNSMASSIQTIGRSIEVAAAPVPKEELEKHKVEKIQSDLIKFSYAVENGKLSEDISNDNDLMKFSNENVANNSRDYLYYLEEARMEDLPLCVREAEFKSTNIVASSENGIAESTSSIESSSTIISEEETSSDE